MLQEHLNGLKAFIADTPLNSVPLLVRFINSTIDLLAGPLTGVRTVHHWPYIVAALVILIGLFTWRFRNRRGFGLGRFLHFVFPKALYVHPSTMVDIKLTVMNNFLSPFYNVFWRLNAVLLSGLLLGWMITAFGPKLGLFEWNLATLLAFTVLISMADDFGFYIFHAASHKIPVLWAFHKVHHSAEVLTPLTTSRAHPVELALTGPFKALAIALVTAPVLYLFTEEPTVIEVFGMNLASAFCGFIGNQLLHSHIWISYGPVFGRIFVSPAMHQIHHSSELRHHDRNFAGFYSVFDWLFGTLYLPRMREHLRFGLYGDATRHTGVITAYTLPFLDALRAVPASIALGLAWLGAPWRMLHGLLAARHNAAPSAEPPRRPS